MKRLFIILDILILATSCQKMMETSPTVEVDKSLILKDAESMNIAMDGVYATFYNRIDFVAANAHQCFGNLAVLLAAELMGEDMVQTAQGPGWFWRDYCYDVRQRYTSKIWRCYFVWTYFYEIIDNVNYILSAGPTAGGSKAEVCDVMAQAYAVRAYSYFMLIQSYQQTYKGHEKLPGVPVYTEPTTTTTKGKGRGTVEGVYKQINADLDSAIVNFGRSGLARKHISHLDIYSTSMIQARVALVQNEWQKAEKAARKVMESPATLLTREQATVVKGTFNDQTTGFTTGKTPFNSISCPSILWGAECVTDQISQIVFASFYSMMDACTNVYYAAETPKCISNWLYAQIPESDIRKGWWNGNIGKPRDKWNYGANIDYNQFKFQWADQKTAKGDYIFMRLEEACLILAEALCRQEKYDDAKAVLAKLMENRDPDYKKTLQPLTGSVQTFSSVGKVSTLLDYILLQRRIELWGETGRIYDILRQAKGWTRYWEINGEITNHSNYLSKYSEYLNFPADYIECIYMIPQVEIDNNPNINAEDQNPYVQN